MRAALRHALPRFAKSFWDEQLGYSDNEALWGTLNGLSGRSKKEVGSRLQWSKVMNARLDRYDVTFPRSVFLSTLNGVYGAFG